MNLEASDSGGFEAFWPATEAPTQRIMTVKIPKRKKTVLFINAPPEVPDSAGSRTSCPPARSAQTLQDNSFGRNERAAPAGEQDVSDPPRQLFSNRTVKSTPARAPELYPEI